VRCLNQNVIVRLPPSPVLVKGQHRSKDAAASP
jgi:hypothetical protein